MLAALLAGGLLAGSHAAANDPSAAVLFSVSMPEARSVAVAGSFNGWSPIAHPMRNAGGQWSVSIPLPAGEHKFMYVIDGKTWITPPDADEFVDDGFGQINGVIVVR